MKAQELMVGDYIMLDGSPYMIEEVSINGWVHILDVAHGSRVALSSDFILDFMQGIQMTPAILEKNGFYEKIDVDGSECYRYYTSANDGYTKITLWYGGAGDWSIEVINYEKFDDNEIVYKNDLMFLKVHEMQHILKMCGIDMGIKI